VLADSVSIPDVLRQAYIFADLDFTALELISSISNVREFTAGEIIFEENSAGQQLYVIIDGEVDIQVNPESIGESPGSRMSTLTTMRRGESFGEMALIDRGLRSATACCAQNETSVIIIPRQQLIQLCEQHPRVGYLLMRNLAADLAMKIRESGFQLREWLDWAHS
jgi:CRP/FNR family transcriptional regulator, cyclic AMP receptor protein